MDPSIHIEETSPRPLGPNVEESSKTADPVPKQRRSWRDLDESILLKIASIPGDNAPISDALKRLSLMSQNKGRHHVVVRTAVLLYRMCRTLVLVCKRWNGLLQNHPHWAIFCGHVECEACKAESPSESTWDIASNILRHHCLPCVLNNLEGSHLLSADHNHPRLICSRCSISDPQENSQDGFDILPRARYWPPLIPEDDAEAQRTGPFGTSVPLPFRVTQEYDDVNQPTVSAYCQYCRTARLEHALHLFGLPSIEDCRYADRFVDVLLRTYIDQGRMPLREVVDLIVRQFWMSQWGWAHERRGELYPKAAASMVVLDALEFRYHEHHEGTAALVADSPNLRHHLAVEDEVCSGFVTELVRSKILQGDWVSALEPVRPATIRAEHPAKCRPILRGCLREVTWVANTEALEWMGRKPSVKVARPCLNPPSEYLRRLFKKTFHDMLSNALCGAMQNVASTISTKKAKTSAVVNPGELDLKRVHKHLREERFWKHRVNMLMEWPNFEEIPLVPTTIEGLPQSTLDVIQWTWDCVCSSISRPTAGRHVAARGLKRPHNTSDQPHEHMYAAKRPRIVPSVA